MTRKTKVGFIVYAVISIILIAAMIAANVLTTTYKSIISTYLNQPTTEIIAGEDTDTTYYASELSEKQLVKDGKKLCEQIVSEGVVLLENNTMESGDKALPLKENERNVHFFSMSSFDFITGGVGSGSIDDSSALRLNDVFTQAGFKVNKTLWDFYFSRYRYDQRSYEQERQGLNTGAWLVKDTNPATFSAEAKASYADVGENDIAITVISRIGGEGADLPHFKYYENSVDEGNDHILQLTTNEKDLLTEVGSKNFGKHIVIINTSNPMELGWIFNEEYGIDAVLMVGTVGQAGLPAIPKILTGETNPSGRLVDTWAFDALSSPTAQNMGKMSFTNYKDFNLGEQYNDYVVYQEGIYVGYRYYETRYYDKMMNQGNAGTYNYDKVVQYPFGYSLSYTDFSLSNFTMEKDAGGDYALSVNVTNTGDTAGKTSVQFYMSAPYIPGSGIERAAVELVEFGKTAILDPGASEVLEVTVPAEYLKSYSTAGEGGYVVQGGDYYFTAAFNAHDAVNDVLAAKEGMKKLCASPLAKKDTVAEDTTTYKVSTQTGATITNQFTFADLNNIGYDVTYLSRSDWKGTFPTTQILAVNQAIVDQQKYWQASDVPVDSSAKAPTMGGDSTVTAIQLMGKSYDDPLWDDLLDRISFDEMQYFIRVGGYRTSAIPSIAFNTIGDQDGPAGISATLIGGGTSCMSYPSEATLGATFNKKLCDRFGKLVGEDGLHATSTNRQIAGWYAPAVNIHRTPFSGRNYEYYSEDVVLSGLMASRVINAVYEKGIVCFLKHFAFNDQESNRNGLCVFGNEQALRQIYLAPFEIALRNCSDGACTAIMSSYNRIGGTWTGACKQLLTNVLRDEWGFVGRVISDYIGSDVCKSYVSIYGGLYAGNDQLLNTNEMFFSLADAKNNPTILNLMRQATHRVLYSAINSAGMNGTSSDTKVVKLVPAWQALLWAVTAVISVAIVLWGVLLVVSYKKKAKKANA